MPVNTMKYYRTLASIQENSNQYVAVLGNKKHFALFYYGLEIIDLQVERSLNITYIAACWNKGFQ
jgi:hypothetical protein